MQRTGWAVLGCLFSTFMLACQAIPAARSEQGSLSQARDLAARRIEESQGPEGYWVTHTTQARVFHEARPEVNTFLQPIMIALLQPLTEQIDLKETLHRARHYALGQIEETGLVRFSPSFDPLRKGPAACPDMTPDADDTALAWSLAQTINSGRLALALAKLRAFRTPGGLFRTWLAEEKDFRCLAPGTDPNPADIGINFHVYLFLSRHDHDASRALCQAMIATVGDSSLWVYSAQAPLIPLLRLADVRRAGCPVAIPRELVRPVDDPQVKWLKAISLLDVDFSRDTKARDEAVLLLRDLAQNRFAAVEASPPLLYHNDLTSVHTRNYWSKDFGYALWLRNYARVVMP